MRLPVGPGAGVADDPRALLALARDMAVAAGERAHAGRRAGLRDVGTKTTATDMVTEWDRATERDLVDTIRALRPDDSIVGEEGASHRGDGPHEWCVDPIDGTTNFLYDLPTWAVSIGVADAAGPLAGAVHVPALRETYTALRGAGAWCNGEAISCSGATDLATSLVCTGFSYAPERRGPQAQRVARMIPHLRDVRRLGAASIDLCFVACGRLDAYFEESLHPWDLAAGALIASEAGARLGDFAGGPLRPAQVLVAAPGIFDALSRLIVGG
ncbi:MAG: inositol monophosphatase family protein [Acidimicrobiia bacterium]